MLPLEKILKILPLKGKIAIGDTKYDYLILDAIGELQNIGHDIVAVPLYTYQLQYCKEKDINHRVTYSADYLITDITYYDELSFAKKSTHSVVAEKVYFFRSPKVIGILNSDPKLLFSVECLNQYLTFTKNYLQIYGNIKGMRPSYFGYVIYDIEPLTDKVLLEDLSKEIKEIPPVIECAVFNISPYKVYKIKDDEIYELK
jgi:hypothetical protein